MPDNLWQPYREMLNMFFSPLQNVLIKEQNGHWICNSIKLLLQSLVGIHPKF